jgi:hypothetical protein
MAVDTCAKHNAKSEYCETMSSRRAAHSDMLHKKSEVVTRGLTRADSNEWKRCLVLRSNADQRVLELTGLSLWKTGIDMGFWLAPRHGCADGYLQ